MVTFTGVERATGAREAGGEAEARDLTTFRGRGFGITRGLGVRFGATAALWAALPRGGDAAAGAGA